MTHVPRKEYHLTFLGGDTPIANRLIDKLCKGNPEAEFSGFYIERSV